MEMTEQIARKVLETVDAGLCQGKGVQKPGQMCVEAAVCYAMGLPHSDEPPCVGRAVRAFKIRLNDAPWSDNTARAKGMRRVAIAQLGSDTIDQKAFANEVALQTIHQILPIALRAAGSLIPAHTEALEGAAVVCEAAADIAAALTAARAAMSLTQKVRAYTTATTAAYAAYTTTTTTAAAYAAYAADAAYATDTTTAAAYAADAAYTADAAYATDAAAYAAYAAYAAKRNSILSKAAEIGVQALIKLGAQGVQWLWLCDGEEANSQTETA